MQKLVSSFGCKPRVVPRTLNSNAPENIVEQLIEQDIGPQSVIVLVE